MKKILFDAELNTCDAIIFNVITEIIDACANSGYAMPKVGVEYLEYILGGKEKVVIVIGDPVIAYPGCHLESYMEISEIKEELSCSVTHYLESNKEVYFADYHMQNWDEFIIKTLKGFLRLAKIEDDDDSIIYKKTKEFLKTLK